MDQEIIFREQIKKREEIIKIIIDVLSRIINQNKNERKLNYVLGQEQELEKIKIFIDSFKSKDYDELSIFELKKNLNVLAKYFTPYLDMRLNIPENDFILKEKYKNLHFDIFKYLNGRDLICLSQTNKRLKDICEDNQKYWKKIYFNEYDYFLNLNQRDQCEILENAKEKYNSDTSLINDLNLKTKYTELKRLNKNWESERPVVTTISTSGCVTCLHLDTKTNINKLKFATLSQVSMGMVGQFGV